MTGVPHVVTWFSICRQLLGRDIVFSCHNSVLFLCRDDVATKVPCRDQDGHDKRLGLQQAWPWARILCYDKVFLCCDRIWPWLEFLCHDRVFSCRDRVGLSEENLCRDRVLYVMTKFIF